MPSRTIWLRGVRPSAARQIAVATSFSVKNFESAEFITIISPASMRAAIAELRAMYVSDTKGLPLETAYVIPHTTIRIERKAANGECCNECARRSQKFFDQAGILRKK